ncbi:MAG: PadR family transcriptional regulator [Candidatus Hadarchaeum sp.]|uniref:PadR family transcriptional regulator n=1 Tax=Candidatus Hadarchaeum sp. TaxID=2883567 RepID=UPI003D095EF0
MPGGNQVWREDFGREMRRGLLSIPLLWILRENGAPMYGYEIIQTIAKTTGGWVPEAGTIYPLLRRLESKGLVKGEWSTIANVPRRRYYWTTSRGKEAEKRIVPEWKRHSSGFREFVQELLGGRSDARQL